MAKFGIKFYLHKQTLDKLMKRSSIFFLIGAITFLGIMTACERKDSGLSAVSITETSLVMRTAIAEEVFRQMTLSAGNTAVAILTERAGEKPSPSPSLTPRFTSLPTETMMSPTTLPATIMVPEVACNRLRIVTESGITNGQFVEAGTIFKKTWRLMNLGSCTWTPEYVLEKVGGNLDAGVKSIDLDRVVFPGEAVNITLELIAPSIPGTYRSEWLMRNPQGNYFGLGEQSLDRLVVQINVIDQATNRVTVIDLTNNYCEAEWSSANGDLICPGYWDDPRGSILYSNGLRVENVRVTRNSLITKPNLAGNGWIQGSFSSYLVQNGDHLNVEIGCYANSPGCSLIFQIDIKRSNGSIINLGAWQEQDDGKITDIDINLSLLAGEEISLLFGVSNQGDAKTANAVWVAPRIENATPAIKNVLTWHRSSTNTCNELRIYLVEDRYAMSEAINCQSIGDSLGTLQLNQEQYYQVYNWFTSLKPIDVEIFDSQAGTDVIAWLSFRGIGDQDARNATLNAIKNLAEELFNTINR